MSLSKISNFLTDLKTFLNDKMFIELIRRLFSVSNLWNFKKSRHKINIFVIHATQRATVESINVYYIIKRCSLIIRKFQWFQIHCLLLFKRKSFVLMRRLSIRVTLKSLLLMTNMEKLSKPDEYDCEINYIPLWQNRYSLCF